jgi:hypothetical protein
MIAHLPIWLKTLWDEGEAENAPDRNRHEQRRTVMASCFVVREGGHEPELAHIFNISAGAAGIGLTLRHRLDIGEVIRLRPSDGAGEAASATVHHCTQTVQGFKIGCSIDTSARIT